MPILKPITRIRSTVQFFVLYVPAFHATVFLYTHIEENALFILCLLHCAELCCLRDLRLRIPTYAKKRILIEKNVGSHLK